jgi:lipopolysaccharide/colanic/teichoic acid biosynthesis glycosyltransferase
MSLVGPRPPLPYELECYDLWHRRRVYELKPGVTGLWQVRGRSLCTFDEMTRLDLQHARPHSLGVYFRVLLETPRAVIHGRGAH